MPIQLEPVGFVKNTRNDLSDDHWGSIISEIELAEGIPSASLDGIDAFSHVEIIFYFNKCEENGVVFSGHPRGNPAWPRVGIFSQRKKDRPNHLGLTIAAIVARNERTLTVKNLDAIDGTPVLDIKPVARQFLADVNDVRQPVWMDELMQDYWKE